MPEVVLYRSVDIDDIARLAPHDDFLHVKARAGIVHAALAADANHGNGIGTSIGQKTSTFDGIHGNIHRRTVSVPYLLSIVKHGSLIFFPFADNDDSIQSKAVEGEPHGVHRRAVARFLVAFSQPAGCGKGC